MTSPQTVRSRSQTSTRSSIRTYGRSVSETITDTRVPRRTRSISGFVRAGARSCCSRTRIARRGRSGAPRWPRVSRRMWAWSRAILPSKAATRSSDVFSPWNRSRPRFCPRAAWVSAFPLRVRGETWRTAVLRSTRYTVLTGSDTSSPATTFSSCVRSRRTPTGALRTRSPRRASSRPVRLRRDGHCFIRRYDIRPRPGTTRLRC